MTITIKKNHFSVLLAGMSVLLITCICSCNNSAPKEDKTGEMKDTVTVPQDTAMKMHGDTTATDTSGKGTQPAPMKK